MPRPTLILIQGAPATGKTTLRKRLETDLEIACLSKDDIKELLFDKLKQSDREFSRIQGKASAKMLFAFAEVFLHEGQSTLIESAFYAELARPEIIKILEGTNARCLEIFCHSNEDIRKERFDTRVVDGTRHPGHLDTVVASSIDSNTYSVLSIGEVIDVDTTDDISDIQYNHIVTTARHYLTEGK